MAAVRIPIGCRHAERMADLSTYGGHEKSGTHKCAGTPSDVISLHDLNKLRVHGEGKQ